MNTKIVSVVGFTIGLTIGYLVAAHRDGLFPFKKKEEIKDEKKPEVKTPENKIFSYDVTTGSFNPVEPELNAEKEAEKIGELYSTDTKELPKKPEIVDEPDEDAIIEEGIEFIDYTEFGNLSNQGYKMETLYFYDDCVFANDADHKVHNYGYYVGNKGAAAIEDCDLERMYIRNHHNKIDTEVIRTFCTFAEATEMVRDD